jgi:hypothetical protein
VGWSANKYYRAVVLCKVEAHLPTDLDVMAVFVHESLGSSFKTAQTGDRHILLRGLRKMSQSPAVFVCESLGSVSKRRWVTGWLGQSEAPPQNRSTWGVAPATPICVLGQSLVGIAETPESINDQVLDDRSAVRGNGWAAGGRSSRGLP